MNVEKISNLFGQILEELGDDVKREGLKDTPNRVAQSYSEFFSGINQDEKEPLKKYFKSESNDVIIIKDIEFYSMCEHHFLPFYGKIDVAYIPKDRIAGFGDIIKCIEIVSKRPQIQERLGEKIADAIYETLECRGVYIKIEATHMCMTMRGVKKENSKIITTHLKGNYKDDSGLRTEVVNLLK